MKAFVFMLFLILAAATATSAQTIDGDWQGTLVAGAVEIRLVVHLTGDAKGGFTATLDSPDQGVNGIAVTSVRIANSTLTFDVAQVGGKYEGTIDSARTNIKGMWSQAGASNSLNLSRPVAASKAARVPKPSEIDGNWEGMLDAGGATLRIVIHVLTFADGMTATMDSPDQKTFGLPATSISRTGRAVQFEMKQLGGSFTGTLAADLTAIDGTWSQLGNSLPLLLKRVR